MNDKEIVKTVLINNEDLHSLAGTQRVTKALNEALSLKEEDIGKRVREMAFSIGITKERGYLGLNEVLELLKGDKKSD